MQCSGHKLNFSSYFSRNENSECISYNGPEVLNPKKLNFDNIRFLSED